MAGEAPRRRAPIGAMRENYDSTIAPAATRDIPRAHPARAPLSALSLVRRAHGPALRTRRDQLTTRDCGICCPMLPPHTPRTPDF